DDAFRKRDHDNDQRDDAPHEMGKSAKRKKDILKFKVCKRLFIKITSLGI
nr:hypothetical protein [Tanacetum cinerariifolium]